MDQLQPAPNLWPYTVRSGVNALEEAAMLLAEPEIQLSDDELSEIRDFSVNLIAGQDDVDGYPLPSFEAVDRQLVLSNAHTYHVGYLQTEAGQATLASIGVDVDNGQSGLACWADLIARGQTPNPKIARELAADSVNWYKDQYMAQLLRPAETDKDFTDPESFSIDLTPDNLLQKLENLKRYKSFYGEIYRQLKTEDDTAIMQVKRTLLNIHVAKVNSQLAIHYAQAFNLVNQLNASDNTPQVETWTRRLVKVIPALGYVCRNDSVTAETIETTLDGFARRLDLLRSGAAPNPEGHNFTPISQELLDMIETDPTDQPSEDAGGAYSQEEVAELARTRWNATDIKDFMEQIVDSWGLLSEHSADWHEVATRSDPAVDQKWQFIISPKVQTLSIDGKLKVGKIPQNFDRGLLQSAPSGGLLVAAHETTHVLQNEADALLAEQVPLAKLKGRRSLIMREMGGLMSEAELSAVLGKPRPRKLVYLRGLQAKLAGGNRAEVTRATYEGRDITTDADTTEEERRKNAYNQTLRLYRKYGHDSQALDYVESELISNALSTLSYDRRRTIATSAASFALADLATLHRIGLIKLPETSNSLSPAQTALSLYMNK